MAFELTAAEALTLAAVETLLEEAFKNGCEQPPGTNVVPALGGYAQLESIGGVDIRPQAKGAFKSALAALIRSFAGTVHLIGGAGEPAFFAAWVNNGDPYHPCGWYVDAAGCAHLQGATKPSGASATGAIFTLPVAPSKQMSFPVITYAGAGRVDVATDGTVSLVTPATATGLICIDNIHFRINA